MKLSRLTLVAILAAGIAPATARAAQPVAPRKVVRVAAGVQTATKAAAATASTTYSVEVPYVRSYEPALPDAYVRTSVDVSNNTTVDGVTASLQYCYSISNVFQGCTSPVSLSLGHIDSFHSDDIVLYLATQGALPPEAQLDSLGTLLVTFNNLPSRQGWEGTVTASTYSRVSEGDARRGTVGCGQVTSLFFESALASLVGTASDTVPAPSLQAGSLGSTLGIHNTDALGIQTPVTVDVTLYDPTTGQPVGNQITLTDIAPGELRLINDLFTQAAVPTNVSTAIVFADTRNTTGNAATIEGFLLTQDTESGDTRYHELKCSAGCAPSSGGSGQSTTLVLNQSHAFIITLQATNQHNNNVTGAGSALPQTDIFGYFSLPTLTGNPDNPEVFVKILDGRPINGAFWMFYGHMTDLIYDLTVTDNVTGVSKTYHKNAGNEAGGFDTETFVAPSVAAPNTKAAPGLVP